MTVKKDAIHKSEAQVYNLTTDLIVRLHDIYDYYVLCLVMDMGLKTEFKAIQVLCLGSKLLIGIGVQP